MPYQTFDDQVGDSDSAAKLQRIRLPENLSGCSVLDIGCNEGFFCKSALERGAARVVGIDINEELIAKARARVPGAEFHVASWWQLPPEKFDYILLLSAIHYEPRQRHLLNYVRGFLRPAGTLILEGGVVYDIDRSDWHMVQRHDGMLKFPTFRLLQDHLLSAYAVRDLGPSVNQRGDPVPRYVFHCTPRSPNVLLVGGPSGAGKTNFARLFGARGVRTIYSDFVLGRLKGNPQGLTHPFITYLTEKLVDNQVDVFTRGMIADGKADAFAAFLVQMLSHDDDVTVIEGFAFSFSEVRSSFEKAATAAGFRTVTVVL